LKIDKPEVNLRYGQTIVTNLNLLVIENDRLTLDCQIQSNPSTIEPITWLKNGASMAGLLFFLSFFQTNQLNKYILGINSPSLILQTIKRSDEGEYTCLTSNLIGRGQASVHIRVQCKITISIKIQQTHFLYSRCTNRSIKRWRNSFRK
jgi:hypothetical protein